MSTTNAATEPKRLSGLEIRLSYIHGRGLFALKDIPRGHVIFSTSDYTTSTEPVFGSVRRSRFMHMSEPAAVRWVNHSCRGNSGIAFSKNEVMIIATEDISEGEEITCDYRLTEDEIPMPFMCNCGHCHGVLIGGRQHR